MKKKVYSKLDDLTIQWMLYNPDSGYGLRNPNAPIDRLIEARGKSRQQILVEENISPPNIVENGMWMTTNYQSNFTHCANWVDFSNLPPLRFDDGPRKGRKQRIREAIANLN